MRGVANVYDQLNGWYNNRLGEIVFAAERYELEKVLPDFFGYHLLQLGGPDHLDWLQSSPIKHHLRYSPELSGNVPKDSVCGLFTDLPFTPESIDVVLLPHLLEFTDQPKVYLKEAVQVLIPEGHIIVLGINPFSLWGMWWMAKHKRKRIPWVGHFHRMGAIRHWLTELDCQVNTIETYFFRPPIADLETRKQLRIFETLGQSCWPWLGGLYIITAQKRISSGVSIKLQPSRPQILTSKDIATSGTMERDKIN